MIGFLRSLQSEPNNDSNNNKTNQRVLPYNGNPKYNMIGVSVRVKRKQHVFYGVNSIIALASSVYSVNDFNAREYTNKWNDL